MKFNSFIKRPIKGLFLFLFISKALSLELSSKLFISQISYVGLSKTQKYVIDREIRHLENIFLDSSLVEEDKARLYNLGLFSDISWSTIPLEDGTFILQYFFIETIQEIPITILPFYDVETGWSIKGVWLVRNYLGRNQTIGIIGSFGGLNTYGLNFFDPWIFGNHISLKMNLTKAFYRHMFLDKDVLSSSVSLLIGKWFKDEIKSNAGFKIIEKDFLNDESEISFLSIIPEASITFDSRNIYWNPSKGLNLYNSINFSIDYRTKSNSFLTWKQSYSFYNEIMNLRKKLILAFNITIYRRWKGKEEVRKLYLGDAYSIRGWPLPNNKIYSDPQNTFRFGYEYIFGSIELRKVIIEKFVTKYQIETGLTLVTFLDFGRIAKNLSELKNQSTMLGSGIGVRIPVPLFDVIRFDLGWGFTKTPSLKPSFHFALMQKF